MYPYWRVRNETNVENENHENGMNGKRRVELCSRILLFHNIYSWTGCVMLDKKWPSRQLYWYYQLLKYTLDSDNTLDSEFFLSRFITANPHHLKAPENRKWTEIYVKQPQLKIFEFKANVTIVRIFRHVLNTHYASHALWNDVNNSQPPKGKSVSIANQNVALCTQFTCENFAY